MKNVIITTTNAIENATIQKYIELISTNVVVGTNLFSDFGAALTDVFGGFSDKYQNKLQKIYRVAISNLNEQASRIGANAIVGLKIDFDEISGKGKSMFMVSAIGMAVSVKFSEKEDSTLLEGESTSISLNRLEQELTKRIIIEQLSKNILPTKDQWDYLLNNPIEDILEVLLTTYLKTHRLQEYDINHEQKLLIDNFVDYIKQINPDKSINCLYSNINLNTSTILTLLNEAHLFSPQKVMELLDNNNLNIGIQCLDIQKSHFTKSDLDTMKQIIKKLESLPDTGNIEVSTVGLIRSTERSKFTCQHGHINYNTEFCEKFGCGIDVKGLKKADYNKIESFKLKVDSLEYLLRNQ